eukprot:3760861-Heterocapsa_arctica.AAC.1
MGAAKEGVGLEDLRSTAVGRPGGRAEGYAAKKFRELLEVEHMAAISTFSVHDQSTYYPSEGRPSRIDYICAPLGLFS